jgi:hypothetical protein
MKQINKIQLKRIVKSDAPGQPSHADALPASAVLEGHAEGALIGTSEAATAAVSAMDSLMYWFHENSTLTLHSHVAVVFRLSVDRIGSDIRHFLRVDCAQ